MGFWSTKPCSGSSTTSSPSSSSTTAAPSVPKSKGAEEYQAVEAWPGTAANTRTEEREAVGTARRMAIAAERPARRRRETASGSILDNRAS
ncbi:hypothetical protein GN958_ATG11174 [Phytophthora infestans]|uniref:Uncharacterized protein n=1 Tax=Phytophthora infestans TaxID=4787 RepID=A0A8S9UKT4_PHYIN|nr:hypothetical protein GN958_ATG11174 [Phytophthora infestans]